MSTSTKQRAAKLLGYEKLPGSRSVPIVSTSPPVPNSRAKTTKDLRVSEFPSYLHLHPFPTPASGMLTVTDS